MTEEQKKKYEDAAKEYSALLPHQNALLTEAAELDFVAGASYAHSEGKKEGWNEAIEAAENALWKYRHLYPIIEELQKLRK